MVLAWYMCDTVNDPCAPNHRNPQEFIDIDEVYKLTGVEHCKLNVSSYREDGDLDLIRKARGYSYEDEITCAESCMPDLEAKLKIFFEEHLHTDEEIRFVLDGSGYFDVRDDNDKWIRIHVGAGDLLVLPRGIFHRFTLDDKRYIKAKRYFVGEPVWVAHNRCNAEVNEMKCRQEYMVTLNNSNSRDEHSPLAKLLQMKSANDLI